MVVVERHAMPGKYGRRRATDEHCVRDKLLQSSGRAKHVLPVLTVRVRHLPDLR
jgi:hypothetical protein